VRGTDLHGAQGPRGDSSSSPVRGTATSHRSDTSSAARWSTVHPRVCGERGVQRRVDSSAGGSSPRVRGTDHSRARELLEHRFIPACAGNGPSSRASSSGNPVHPRVCGERSKCSSISRRSSGSSPRVRGTDLRDRLRHVVLRFIPACAGNGQRRAVPFQVVPVHLRVCGERFRHVVGRGESDGSSPRVRGTAESRHPGREPCRFIPACAGNGVNIPGRRGIISVHPRVCGER